jgi:hypothetical protein
MGLSIGFWFLLIQSQSAKKEKQIKELNETNHTKKNKND